MFLDREPGWQNGAEPIIAEFRADSRVEPPPESVGLLASAPHEVRAAQAAWTGDWADAGEEHHQAAEALMSYPTAQGYRGYQLFLAAVGLNAAGRLANDDGQLLAADAIATQAVGVAAPATWMRSSMPLPGAPERPLNTADQIAVDAIAALLEHAPSSARHNASVGAMVSGLAAIDHAEYEPALSKLGIYLGAESSKPPGDGRPDAVWCWGDALWITLEAKSEHKPDGQIGLDDVRQVNVHLGFLAADRSAPVPAAHASVMISPRPVFKRDAVLIAEPFTFRVFPDDLLSLGAAVEQTWLRLRTLKNLTDAAVRRESVSTALREARLLPTDVLDRLTTTPIRGS